jgi:ATP-binding cassette subfamily F protein 3
MDEPTNHLDIGSCEALEQALQAFEGTIIAVSQDRYFINQLATRIIELAPEHERGLLDYNLEEYDEAFSEYMRIRAMRKESLVQAEKSKVVVTDAKQAYEDKKRESAKRRSEEKRKQNAEKKIGELETELARLDEELFGEAATNYVRAAEIDKRKNEIDEELLELYEIVYQE